MWIYSCTRIICWKDYFFPIELLVTLSNTNWPHMYGLSILLHWSLCLSLCQYNYNSRTVKWIAVKKFLSSKYLIIQETCGSGFSFIPLWKRIHYIKVTHLKQQNCMHKSKFKCSPAGTFYITLLLYWWCGFWQSLCVFYEAVKKSIMNGGIHFLIVRMLTISLI